MKLIELIDIYGSPFNFTIYGNKTFKTNLGGILTLLTITLLFIFIFLLGKDFLKKNKSSSIL